jgi:hypothetical protein
MGEIDRPTHVIRRSKETIDVDGFEDIHVARYVPVVFRRELRWLAIGAVDGLPEYGEDQRARRGTYGRSGGGENYVVTARFMRHRSCGRRKPKSVTCTHRRRTM